MVDFRKIREEQKETGNMDFSNIRVAVWDNDYAEGNPKAPMLRGKLTNEEGEVLAEVSFWKNDKYEKGGKQPRLTGRISPPYVKEGAVKKQPSKGDF